MPENGFMQVLCLIGLLTLVYFVGMVLDFVQDYFPYFIYYVIGAAVSAYAIVSWTQEWRRRRHRTT